MSRILVVDDEFIITTQLEENLSSAGYEVVGRARSGEEAVKMAREHRPDLVLMDIVMPGEMDGIAAAQVLKDELDIPSIFITAYGENVLVERAKHVEPFGYIMKPVDTRQVLAAVEVALHKKDMETRLRESEERFRLAFENANIGVCLVDTEGRLMRVNDQMSEIFGYSKEELEAMNVNDIAHPDYKDVSPTFIRRAASGELTHAEFEKQYFHKEGHIVWGRVSSSLARDSRGEPLHFISHVQDITELKKAQAEQAALLERNRSLVEALGEIVYDWRPPSDELIWDGDYKRVLGYTTEEMGNDTSSWTSRVHPDDLERVLAEVEGAARERRLYDLEYRFRCKDGSYRWMHDSGVPFLDDEGTLKRVIGVFRDITKQKRAQQAQERSAELLQTFVDHSPAAVAMFDRDMKYIMASRRYLADYRLKEQDLIGRSHYEVFPEIPERWKEIHRRCLAGAAERAEEDPFPRADGSLDWVRWEILPWYEESGEIGGIILFSEVITDRKRAEEALRWSETRYRVLFNSSNDSLFVHQPLPDGTPTPFIEVNDVACRRYGYTREELMKLTPADIVAPEEREKCRRMLRRVLKEGKALFQTVHITKHGKEIPVEISARIFDLEDHRTVLSSVRDITKRKQAEDALLRANRALKTLSGCNEALVRATDEQQLLDDVCRLIIEKGGFRMAWVGFALDDEDKSVRPMAYEGIEEGYLEKAGIVWSDTQRGRGPTGTAIRTGEKVVCQDMSEAMAFAPWREEAEKRGYASSIALPIEGDGRTIGALNIYAGEPDAFDEEEVRLLGELASDISYGIAALRTREERRKAEEALRESEAYLNMVINRIADPMIVKDSEHRWVLVNDAFCEMVGHAREELLGKSDYDFFPKHEAGVFWEKDNEVLTTGEENVNEETITDASGRVIDLVTKKTLYVSPAGEKFVVAIGRDVTEQRKAEEQLRRNYDTQNVVNTLLNMSLLDIPLDELLEHAIDSILSIDWMVFEKQGAILSVEDEPDVLVMKAQKNLTEPIRETCARVPFGTCLCGRAAKNQRVEFADRVDERHEVCYKGMEPHGHYCVPILSAEKTLGVLNIYLREGHSRDEREEQFLIAVANVLAGIIERKSSEEALHKSEERFALAMKGANDGLWDWNLETNEVYYSPRWKSMLGYEEHEVGNHYNEWARLVHPDDLEGAVKHIEAYLKGDEPKYEVEFRMRHKDGSYRSILSRGFAVRRESDGKMVRLVGTHVDITELKAAEEAARESEHRFRELFDRMPSGVAVFEAKGKGEDFILRDFNRASERITGRKRDEVIGRPVTEVFPGVKEMGIFEVFQQVYTTGVPGHQPPALYQDDRVSFWVESYVYKLPSDEVVIVYEDTTDRKRAEEALRESEKNYRLLVNTLPAVVFKGYPDWSVDFFDDKVEAITGYKKEDFDSRKVVWRDLIHEEDIGRIQATIKEASRTTGSYVREYRIRDKSGNIHWVEGRGQIIKDAEGKLDHIVGVLYDVTDYKRMEKELAKSEKLDSLGILAGGIGHDFNNMLTSILGNIMLAKDEIFTDQEFAVKALTRAENAGIRASDLAKQLLTFSRGGAPVRVAASIADLLKDTARFVLSGSNVKAEFEIPDDLWPVSIDTGQISQVFSNLFINAQQAMPEGGRVRVVMENKTVGLREPYPIKEGRYVEVSIQDEGTGIPEEHLSRIFDPFFTTKDTGSGLGLAMAYSIVNQHGGHIAADSVVGEGTTFFIYLPASEEEVLSEEQEEPVSFAGEGRILVMDDDEAVREFVMSVLETAGHEAVGAQDGAEAIELYREAMESGLPFDAVVMDVTVPGGMGGKEAIEKLREIDPRVKAIVASGYATDPIMADPGKYGFKGSVPKPFKPEELREVVGKVLKDSK